ncbi:MAG: hypothetical protein KC912_08430 [Proteobacteria bacterium]|nr:hypothetical protein [Pseudomonadota bacterium]
MGFKFWKKNNKPSPESPSPKKESPEEWQSNEQMQHLLNNGSYMSSKDREGTTSMTPEQLKELAKLMPKPGSGSEDWENVPKELRPDRLDGTLGLFQSIDKERKKQNGLLHEETPEMQSFLTETDNRTRVEGTAPRRNFDDMHNHSLTPEPPKKKAPKPPTKRAPEPPQSGGEEMDLRDKVVDRVSGLFEEEPKKPLTAPTTRAPLPPKDLRKPGFHPENEKGLTESWMGTFQTSTQVGQGLEVSGGGLSTMVNHPDKMTSTSGLMELPETTEMLGTSSGFKGLGMVDSGLSLTQNVLKTNRGKELRENGNTAQKQLGDNLVDEGLHDVLKDGLGTVKSGLSGTKDVLEIMKMGGQGVLENVVPGVGMVMDGIETVHNYKQMKKYSGMEEKTKEVRSNMDENDPMQLLGSNLEGQHNKNRKRERDRMVVNGVSTVTGGLNFVPGLQGASLVGTALKGGLKAKEFVQDNKEKHDIQSMREKAAFGDNKAKEWLLKNDPRMLGVGLGMYSGMSEEGRDEVEVNRIKQSRELMKTMGVTEESMDDGTEHDLQQLVYNNTRTDEKQKKSWQAPLPKLLTGGKIGKFDNTV